MNGNPGQALAGERLLHPGERREEIERGLTGRRVFLGAYVDDKAKLTIEVQFPGGISDEAIEAARLAVEDAARGICPVVSAAVTEN